MRKNKLLIIIIMILMLCSVGMGTVYASTYNGESDSFGGSSNSSCVDGAYCNNTTFKAVSVTLYWIEAKGEMKKVSGTKTIVINNGKGNGPSKNCSSIGGKNWCTKSSWFSSKTYGYNSAQISNDIGGGDPNKVDSARIRRMGKWIAALFGESKTFDSAATARKYVIQKLPKYSQSCIVDKASSKNQCAEENGYRIVIEPVIGYQKNGKYYTGKLKSVIQTGIGAGTGHQNVFNNLLATSFKDVGIDYKNISKCTYEDLGKKKNVNGCGWNIIDLGIQPDTPKHTCEIYKDSKGTTYYDKCLDANGNPTLDASKCVTEQKIVKKDKENITGISSVQKYTIPSYSQNEYTLNEVKSYIGARCVTTDTKCEVLNGKCYYMGTEYSCSSDKGKWIQNGCPPCWYGDTATDTCSANENMYFYYDTSGEGKSITQSLRRVVHQFSATDLWNHFTPSPSCSSGDRLVSNGSTTSYPNFRYCDNSLSTADCTHDSSTRSNYKCQTYVKNGCSYTYVDHYEDVTVSIPWFSFVDGKITMTTIDITYQRPVYATSYYDCWLDNGTYFSYTPSWRDTNRNYMEYYITGVGWLNCGQATNWISNNCTYSTPKCAFDTENKEYNSAWYDNNGNHHIGGLTKKISLWINKGCPVSREKTKVECSNCSSTSTDGGGFTIKESTNWDQILGNYYGANKENEDDLIEQHYLRTSNDNGDQVYCSEQLTIKLPNGKTTNLGSAKSGRFITVNLADSYDDIMNLAPITVTKTSVCRAINNSEVTVSQGQGIRSLYNLASSSANTLLYNYVLDLKNSIDISSFGNVKLVYNDTTYDLNTYLVPSITKNNLSGSGDNYTLTQEATYTLGEDIYRYTSVKDGSVSESAPYDLSKYYDLGVSTLPVRFSNPFNANVSFVYDYDGTTFEDEFDNQSTWIDSSGLSCVSNIKNSNYYTCPISNTSAAKQDKCKIQKTTNGTKYYYNYQEVSENYYKSKCSCLEKNGNYYLNGTQISKEEYDQVCPPQCSTVCPAGEICCPTGGTDMPCSVNGVCPNSSGDKLIYRTIDLSNPFPGQNTKKQGSSINQGRKTGANWCSYNIKTQSINCSNLNDGTTNNENKSTANGIVSKHIKNNAGASEEDIYRQTPQYSITLNSQNIDKIRSYNKTQKNSGGYDDFTLTCHNVTSDEIRTNLYANGIYTTNICRSDFVRNNNLNLNLSGTCASSSWDNLLVCSERSVK